MQVSAPGSNERQLTVDEFLKHIDDELRRDARAWTQGEYTSFSGDHSYSVNADGTVEILYLNGLFICSKEEFEDLKQKTPDVNWKEYPNDWAADEIDDVIDYLSGADLVQGLKDDPDGAMKHLMIYLGSHPQDAGDGFPSWLEHIPHDKLEKLAKGILQVLDIVPTPAQTPTDMVDKMLDEE